MPATLGDAFNRTLFMAGQNMVMIDISDDVDVDQRRHGSSSVTGATDQNSDKTMKICTHAQVCTNDQVIRATSPHTAPVRGPCYPHGAATAVGFRGNLGLRRWGRWWWWGWNWNTHTYWQCTGRGKRCMEKSRST